GANTSLPCSRTTTRAFAGAFNDAHTAPRSPQSATTTPAPSSTLGDTRGGETFGPFGWAAIRQARAAVFIPSHFIRLSADVISTGRTATLGCASKAAMSGSANAG